MIEMNMEECGERNDRGLGREMRAQGEDKGKTKKKIVVEPARLNSSLVGKMSL